ncbi:MAG: YciI family protein [Caulobacterales bacterium]|jgi:hypothetical protein
MNVGAAMAAEGADERRFAQGPVEQIRSTVGSPRPGPSYSVKARRDAGLAKEVAMRVMVIVKASKDSEAGTLPSPGLIEAMGAYNNELIAAGVMLDAGGLQTSAKGARVKLHKGSASVTDGPFTETKELIAGYWVWQVKSLQDAIAWARKAPTDGDREFNLEIRPFFEPEDFSGVAPPEIIAQEQGWRDDQARKAPGAVA